MFGVAGFWLQGFRWLGCGLVGFRDMWLIVVVLGFRWRASGFRGSGRLGFSVLWLTLPVAGVKLPGLRASRFRGLRGWVVGLCVSVFFGSRGFGV